MKRSLSTRYLLLAITPLLLSPLAVAADLANGKALHDGNCTQCHTTMFGGDGSGIYTRDNRRVKSLPGLDKQVRFCAQNLGHTWFDDEIGDVSNYLNSDFYHLTE